MQNDLSSTSSNLTNDEAKAIFNTTLGDAFQDSGSSPPDLLVTALDLANRGWAVFPLHGVSKGTCTCSSGSACGTKAGKHPRTENGKDDATTNPTTIREWWSSKPDSNIGIRVGGQSGIVVIDIDPRNGGDVSLGRLLKENGALPATPTAQTGGGGLHFFFKDPGIKLAGKLAQGIDVKQNGHVVGHGSTHASGKRYAWKAGCSPTEVTVAELPEWMSKLLSSATTKTSATSAPGEILEGNRNEALFKIASSMVKRGVSTEAVEAALLADNKVRCKPPLDDREVSNIVKSAERNRGIDSVAPSVGVPTDRKIEFITAADVAASVPPEPEWILKPWFARGAVTEITGSAKAAGKTTLIFGGINAVINGQTFLNEPTKKTAVVYLTEERAHTLAAALRRGGLLDTREIYFVMWHSVAGMKLDDVINAAVEKCGEVGAKLLVIDTLSQFANFRGDGENNSGTALEATMPLQMAASKGLSVVVVRHERKGGGEVGQAGRGSSAFAGAADISIASTAKEASTGRLVTQEYRVEGPTQLMLTTTAIEIDEELLNRCIVLTVDEDRRQTKAIHQLQRERETLDGFLARNDRAAILKLHQDAQRLLRPLLVVNPYARELTFLDDRTRTRRDHVKYLALIRVVALLHQYQRTVHSVTHGGKATQFIEVTPSDVAVANKLAHEVLGRSLDELPPQTRMLLLGLERLVSEDCKALSVQRGDYRFTRRFVRERLGWGDTQLKIHLQRLVDLEYVLVHRTGPARSHVYELLYDGGGKDGTPFLTGLIDASTLQVRTYDDQRSGLEAQQSGGRSGFGRWGVGHRSG